MKISSWNVRGLSAFDKICLVKRALTKMNSDVFLLQETKIKAEKVDEFKKYFYKWGGHFQDSMGSLGCLGILWKSDSIEVRCIASCDFWMACSIKCKRTNLCFPLFNIYGPIRTEDKLRVWNKITIQANLGELGKVIMARDFNAILDFNDKAGGLRKPTKVMEDFREFVYNCRLVDVIPKKWKFTWNNHRVNFSNISELLDKFFVGEWWVLSNHTLETSIEPHCGLDHLPITLAISHEQVDCKSYFKFLNMWWQGPSLLDLLRSWWAVRNIFSGSPNFKFVKRTQFLKCKLKEWNKHTFKNVFAKKERIESIMEELNNLIIANGMTNLEYEAEKLLKKKYAEILTREEVYWKDKSRENWIAEGDSNTIFFHSSV
ncbi:uncharacterized protein LOC131858342 [Cryptomeria japonica]|uniref:uncharacterized protein LOC131858342 n=1 Tax=Cryptomeria japonica TaxID=3369 RepID=UPI0027DA4E6B|nr:uncharacterized protein LOC131858342 [Cryptomeria japonica]